jgi:S-ribosylhomocysteine lyase LuxS involved in autoinducer biosynthesis
VVYPNPVYKTLNIHFPETYKGNYSIELIDAVGKTFKLNSLNVSSGRSSTPIDISSLGVRPGIYLLKIQSTSGKNDVVKVVIE